MYSWELDNYFNSKNYHVSDKEFQNLRSNSPQINRIKFEEFGNTYSRFTVGTSDNYNFQLWIKNYNQED
jgi:hypothetical protein